MRVAFILMALPFTAAIVFKYLFGKILIPKNRWGLKPTGMGFIYVISSLTAFAAGFSIGVLPIDDILIYIIGMFGMGMVGLTNDTFRDDTPFYYRTQLKGILKGDRQSRLIKAIITIFIAQIISMVYSTSYVTFFVNMFIVILMTNFLNILDSGPGRASKSFLLIFVFIAFSAGFQMKNGISLIMLGAVSGFVSSDLKSRLYMGEIGANVLGVWLGMSAVEVMPMLPKTILLILLLGFNLYGEFFDISSTIEKNPLLKAIDRWGR